MKLKAIASLFNANKILIIYTDKDGEQWLSNGAAAYSMRGMPHMTPEIVLRIFDVPPDKQSKWHTREEALPEALDFSDISEAEQEIGEPLKVGIMWRGNSYHFYKDGSKIYSFNVSYFKPLCDEDAEYLTFHKRETKNGGFALAVKVALELKAVIMPSFMHSDDVFTDEIKHISQYFQKMKTLKNLANAAEEVFGSDCNINADTGEVTENEQGELTHEE
ncbi:MAG: hypothetical protein FWD48_01090 [Oscillospiraceae bacterium]|nr:hypothetical protein [Oscillospiraceae bacterium]